MSNVALQQVGNPGGEPRNYPETLFRTHMRGEMTKAEFSIAMADWVADNLFKYPPRRYLELSHALRSYADGRLAGKFSRNHENAVNLGLWCQIVVKYRAENELDLDLLRWSVDQCNTVGLVGKVRKLQAHVDEFYANKFPEEDFSFACGALRMDHEERMQAVGK